MGREERRAARMARRAQRQVVEVDVEEEEVAQQAAPPQRRREVVPEPEVVEVDDEETELEEDDISEEVEPPVRRQPAAKVVDPVAKSELTLESLEARVAELEKLMSNGTVAKVAHKTAGKSTGRLPADFWDNIHSDEYKNWHAEWSQKTYEDKVAYARKKGITWEEHESERYDHMRVTLAVMKAEGIERDKPEYRERSDFMEAKRLAKLGLPY